MSNILVSCMVSCMAGFYIGDGLFQSLATAQGSDLDAYAKQWRLFADIFNNVGKRSCSHAQDNVFHKH